MVKGQGRLARRAPAVKLSRVGAWVGGSGLAVLHACLHSSSTAASWPKPNHPATYPTHKPTMPRQQPSAPAADTAASKWAFSAASAVAQARFLT